ncbi:MAG: phospholipid transport system transporter-binding protein [Gammaproteobacteria bacterium]|jgi:phospholipid transport system transporter-binding protein
MIDAEEKRMQISGPLTFDTHASIRQGGTRERVTQDIDVDLSEVTDVDSSALALIFHWQRNSGERKVTLVNPPESLLALAALYGVEGLLSVRTEP